MNTHADLEIGLHRKDADSYTVELRFSQPDDHADLAPERGLAHFDFEDLRAHTLDSKAYGQRLTQSLFSDPPVLAIFSKACAVSQALDRALRLRLFIDRSAPELHSLRWETLQNPQDGSSLITSEHILFSRYLRSLDWRPVRLRPRGDLRALVVIANPANLIDYKLAPIDAADEVRRVKSGLGNISVNELASQGSATLENLLAYLRQGYDIFYLVCHGTLDKSEPWLWMEDEVGNVARVPGSELVTRLSELQQRPALVVLASCQSAGSDANRPRISEGVLAALGPRLAEAGIPAVLAMQGDVSMQTVAQFMPVFFQELQRDGQIDRAMAVARGAVRDRPDSWMPVLFMRLKSGRIWYTPGFTGEFKKWPVLLRSIRDGQCTPILGPGLTESLLGSSREIARRWAETYHFPLAPHDRDDLPQVAQYLAVNQAPGFPRSELREYLRQEILQRYGSTLPPETHTASLDEMVQVVGAQRRAIDPTEPHNVLAHLPFPIFITTNSHNLLAMALRDADKQPEVELCPWNEWVEQAHSIYEDDPNYRPTTQRPLVYHLLGQMEQPDSVVLTEDDYFDFLIGVTSKKELIPGVVRRALADSALLFIGFQLDDWSFRVLFRSLMSQEGRNRRSRYAHIAVQIDPDEGRILEPEGARRYLQTYFEGEDINIYWGSAEDFLKELIQRYPADAFKGLLSKSVGGA